MMKNSKKVEVLLGLASLLTTGCGKSSGSGAAAAPTTLTATLSGAAAVGRVSSSSSSTASNEQDRAARSDRSATNPTETVFGSQNLVGIDAFGNLQSIFNADITIYGVKTTTGSVVAAGSFDDVVINQVGSDGQTLEASACSLIAVSKSASGDASDIQCITTDVVGSFNPILAVNNPFYDHLGFRTVGNTVYYADATESAIYQWHDGDTSPTKIASVAKDANGNGFIDVFADINGSGNICGMVGALSGSAGITAGGIYCGQAGSTLAKMSLDSTLVAETSQMQNFVALNDQKINLATLTLGSRIANGNNGGLPTSLVANYVTTSDGGAIYIGDSLSVVYMDSSGNTYVLGDLSSMSSYALSIFVSGNYAWVLQTSDVTNITAGVMTIASHGVRLTKIDTTAMVANAAAIDAYVPTNPSTTAFMTTLPQSMPTGVVTNSLALTSTSEILMTGTQNGNTVYATINSAGTISDVSTSQTTLDLKVNL